MKARRKSQSVSHVATKSRIIRIATGAAVDKSSVPITREPKNGDRSLSAGLAKAAKVYRNARAHRNPLTDEADKSTVKPTVKLRRASATSDEVFAALAKAFSPL